MFDDSAIVICMKRFHCRLALSTSAFLLIVALWHPAVWAHQDYAGDVHPRVFAVGNQFHVYFVNNRQRKAFKLTFDENGKRIGGRVAIKAIPRRGPNLPEIKRGPAFLHRGSWVVFPNWYSKHKGQPFALFFAGKKQTRRQSLSWPRAIEQVDSAAITQKQLVLLVTHRSSAKRAAMRHAATAHAPFHLYAFDYKGRLNAAVPVGNPARIYSFAVVSNGAVVRRRVGEEVLFCWIAKRRLWLTRWSPKKSQLKTVKLGAADSNTSISIATIKDRVLIAYHAPGRGGAVINVITQRL
jgi:hypothetical protein